MLYIIVHIAIRNFRQKQNFEYHLKICSIKKEIEYQQKIKDLENKLKIQEEKYETKINDLQNQIERMVTAAINRPPININQNNQRINQNNQRINQIINNLTPLTEQHLKDQVEFLTIDHVKNGINGYVKYALDYPLKDKIICTDFSRRKIKYKDDNGNLIEDPEMTKLSQKLFKAIEEKNSILINEYINELYENYNITITDPNNEMDFNESENYILKLDILFDELCKIKNQKREVDEIVNGNKNNVYYEFIKDICSKTVK